MKPTKFFHRHEPWDDRGRGMAGRERRARQGEAQEEILEQISAMLDDTGPGPGTQTPGGHP